ncbi:Retrovirus-related Pol polyprotein from transposon gypsy [Trichinella zimbabwensis]|uniref:Retrovirus-related Pol polyprotein from transposon gypsy n=1 Tax=Trichinella zimbabwensis TaxID=268475 RepID=A0A0V1GXQ3_9BILA|nr:Retrovirus-related Pol polyprotein from transposon gypsy [Trichinella zimbabwensis]
MPLLFSLIVPPAVKSNYKLLVGTLKSNLNPKASLVAAFDEFQRATLMTGERFAQRLQLLLDRSCVTEDKMTKTTLLLHRFISAVDRAQLFASIDGQLDAQTTATTHEMSTLMEEMKRKIEDLAKRLDQIAIHNQAHGAVTHMEAAFIQLRNTGLTLKWSNVQYGLVDVVVSGVRFLVSNLSSQLVQVGYPDACYCPPLAFCLDMDPAEWLGKLEDFCASGVLTSNYGVVRQYLLSDSVCRELFPVGQARENFFEEQYAKEMAKLGCRAGVCERDLAAPLAGGVASREVYCGGEFSGAMTTAHWLYETREERCGVDRGDVGLRDGEPGQASPATEANGPMSRRSESRRCQPGVGSAGASRCGLLRDPSYSETGEGCYILRYHKLNAVTRIDAQPISRIDDTLDALAGAQWFSTLDLASGYWNVEVAAGDREKTTFFILGLFQFRVMPLDVCNALTRIQRLMENALRKLTWKTCLVYLDDIIIFSSSEEEQLERLEGVLLRLRPVGLKHRISTDPEKTAAVQQWPVPQCVSEAAHGARVILLAVEKEEEAFNLLKRALVSPLIPTHPDFDRPLMLDVDASKDAIRKYIKC